MSYVDYWCTKFLEQFDKPSPSPLKRRLLKAQQENENLRKIIDGLLDE